VTDGRHGPAADRGAALLIALIATLVVAAIGLGLVTMTNLEAAIAANHRDASRALHAADAAASRVCAELGAASSWNMVLSGAVQSVFTDATLTPTLADGRQLDLNAMTLALQVQSDARFKRGADNPQWRLFLFSPFARVARSPDSPEYVAAWVADDASESDGDPFNDGNGLVALRAVAAAPGGTLRIVEATVRRQPFGASIVAWREVR
jgi:hypothetical protein